MWRTGNFARPGRLAALLCAVLLSAFTCGMAAADDQAPLPIAPAAAPSAAAIPPSPSTEIPPPPPPPSGDGPGFLHELGVLWSGSFGDFDAKMKKAWGRLDEFNRQSDHAAQDATVATQEVIKDAATAVVRLPTSRTFEMRDRCRTAGNGAPDCQTTAADVCRGKGFRDGHPLDVSTQQDCPARVMLSGQPPADGECTDKTFLLRVICQ